MIKESHTNLHLSYQVVIKFTEGFRLPDQELDEEHNGISTQWRLLELFPGVQVKKLFHSVGSEQIKNLTAQATKKDPTYHAPDFFSFYSLNCPVSIDPSELLTVLGRQEIIEHAYIENIPARPPALSNEKEVTALLPNYLLPAPFGVNALYAWNFKGGNGEAKIKFVDIEQGWLFNHENVSVKTLSCTGINHDDFQDHGIGVLGIIMMQHDDARGITPNANGFVISQWRPDGFFNTSDAIMAAINELSCGDILLLEMQCFESASSSKLWPIEIQEAVFHAIRLATALGIIVIETAGNGDLESRKGNDLDNLVIKGKKILNRDSIDFRDSGAIFVSACSNDLPHQRADFANYGSRVDCFAYGQNVHTTGNFPRSSGMAINTFTNQFGGTSAAAAIVTGATVAIQCISERNKEARLSPGQMRFIVSSELYNTISANGKKDKIGRMPDLKKIIDYYFNINATNKKQRQLID